MMQFSHSNRTLYSINTVRETHFKKSYGDMTIRQHIMAIAFLVILITACSIFTVWNTLNMEYYKNFMEKHTKTRSTINNRLIETFAARPASAVSEIKINM
jgi:hypothetical protein